MLDHSDVEQVKLALQRIEEFDFARATAESLESIKVYVNGLRHYLPMFVHSVPMRDLFRISVNRQILRSVENARLTKISQLKYPPPEKTGFNRANLPKTSVLYASFAKIIPIQEMKPEKNHLITVSRWRIRPRTVVRVAAIFQDDPITRAMPYFEPYLARFNEMLASQPAAEAEMMRTVTSFIAQQFTKVVEPGRKADYLISAFVSDLLLNHNGVEAIIYPSVPSRLLDVNVAIRPDIFDASFDPVEASEEIVNSDFRETPDRFYSSRTARATQFDAAADSIAWDPSSVPADQLRALHSHSQQ